MVLGGIYRRSCYLRHGCCSTVVCFTHISNCCRLPSPCCCIHWCAYSCILYIRQFSMFSTQHAGFHPVVLSLMVPLSFFQHVIQLLGYTLLGFQFVQFLSVWLLPLQERCRGPDRSSPSLHPVRGSTPSRRKIKASVNIPTMEHDIGTFPVQDLKQGPTSTTEAPTPMMRFLILLKTI